MAEVVVGEVMDDADETPETDTVDFFGTKVEVYKPTTGLMMILSSIDREPDGVRQARMLTQALRSIFVDDAGQDALTDHLLTLSRPGAVSDTLTWLGDVVKHFQDGNRQERRAAAKAARRPAKKAAKAVRRR